MTFASRIGFKVVRYVSLVFQLLRFHDLVENRKVICFWIFAKQVSVALEGLWQLFYNITFIFMKLLFWMDHKSVVPLTVFADDTCGTPQILLFCMTCCIMISFGVESSNYIKLIWDLYLVICAKTNCNYNHCIWFNKTTCRFQYLYLVAV